MMTLVGPVRDARSSEERENVGRCGVGTPHRRDASPAAPSGNGRSNFTFNCEESARHETVILS